MGSLRDEGRVIYIAQARVEARVLGVARVKQKDVDWLDQPF